MPASNPARYETVKLRISAKDRNLIDSAAKALGVRPTSFVLEAALSAAQEALLDQTHMTVSVEAFSEFERLLDAPPESNEGLQRLMRTPQPWKT